MTSGGHRAADVKWVSFYLNLGRVKMGLTGPASVVTVRAMNLSASLPQVIRVVVVLVD
jgi:hypothetical protein